MEVICRKLRQGRGEISLRLGVILLVGSILLLISLQLYHAFASSLHLKERANAAVLATAAANVSGIYGGTRESSGTVRRPSFHWDSTVFTDDVKERLLWDLGAFRDGDDIVRHDAFRIRQLRIDYINREGVDLQFTTHFLLELEPVLSFFPKLSFPLEVNSKYEPKF